MKPLDLEGIRKRNTETDGHGVNIIIDDDIEALLSECESLRTLLTEAEKALEFIYAHLGSMDTYSLASGARQVAKEALAKIRQAKG